MHILNFSLCLDSKHPTTSITASLTISTANSNVKYSSSSLSQVGMQDQTSASQIPPNRKQHQNQTVMPSSSPVCFFADLSLFFFFFFFFSFVCVCVCLLLCSVLNAWVVRKCGKAKILNL